MINSIRSEIWKAMHNVYFYVALSVGLFIAVLNAVQNAEVVADLTERTIWAVEKGTASGSYDGFSLFVRTLPYVMGNYASILYQFVWPILAAMPFAWSYCVERRSGLYNQIITRGTVGRYIVSKYVAVFVSGGIAVAFPIIVDLLLNALICPMSVIDTCDFLVAIANGWFFSELYYTDPWAHATIWCVVVFFLGGAVAGLSFLVGTKIRLKVLVILVPFAILTIWNVVYNNVIYAYFREYLPTIVLSPLQMIRAASSLQNPEWLIVATISLLSILGLSAGFWQVKHHELV